MAGIKSQYRNRLQLESDFTNSCIDDSTEDKSPGFKHAGPSFPLSKYC
jgi:hypothetical protein